MADYGVSSTGFVKPRLSDLKDDLDAGLTQAFGATVNTAPGTIFNQLSAVFAERFALLWEGLETVYNATTVNCEGVSVDNLLSLNGLTRLGAKASVTNPASETLPNGVTLRGLVLTGTPGTQIPEGSIIQTSFLPVLSFTLDAAQTIATGTSATQRILLSLAPTGGAFTLTLTAASGEALTTTSLAYNAKATDVAAAIAALVDPTTSTSPFTDVEVLAPSATLWLVNFGAATPTTGNPSSAKMQQPLITIQNNSLVASGTAINVQVTTSVTGAPDAAYGQATCTQTGANAAGAQTLTVIGSGTSGWSGVYNELAVVTGRAIETDTEALTRRESLLASRGSGALPSVVSSIAALDDVTAAIGFQNTTNQAQQVVVFNQAPTTGAYALAFRGSPTTSLAYSASASDVQAALQNIAGLAETQVSGSAAFGLTCDFGAAFGGQALELLTVAANTTDASITPYFGRAPKSVEVVVEGGDAQEIASTLFASLPAGIGSYAQPLTRTLGSSVAGSTQVSLGSVTGLVVGATLVGQGLYPNTVVQSISGNTATVSPAALATASSVPMVATNAATVYDLAGNAHTIQFSRPLVIPVFVQVTLVTDYYLQPGNTQSGVNPSAKFDPVSIATLQADIVSAINATPIGQTLVARGSNGIANSFRSVAGLLDADVMFDFTENPTNTKNLALPGQGLANAEAFNVSVSFT